MNDGPRDLEIVKESYYDRLFHQNGNGLDCQASYLGGDALNPDYSIGNSGNQDLMRIDNSLPEPPKRDN